MLDQTSNLGNRTRKKPKLLHYSIFATKETHIRVRRAGNLGLFFPNSSTIYQFYFVDIFVLLGGRERTAYKRTKSAIWYACVFCMRVATVYNPVHLLDNGVVEDGDEADGSGVLVT